MPNLPTDSSKKLPTEGGRGQKSWKIADVLKGWSLTSFEKFCLENIKWTPDKTWKYDFTVFCRDMRPLKNSRAEQQLYICSKIKQSVFLHMSWFQKTNLVLAWFSVASNLENCLSKYLDIFSTYFIFRQQIIFLKTRTVRLNPGHYVTK